MVGNKHQTSNIKHRSISSSRKGARRHSPNFEFYQQIIIIIKYFSFLDAPRFLEKSDRKLLCCRRTVSFSHRSSWLGTVLFSAFSSLAPIDVFTSLSHPINPWHVGLHFCTWVMLSLRRAERLIPPSMYHFYKVLQHFL